MKMGWYKTKGEYLARVIKRNDNGIFLGYIYTPYSKHSVVWDEFGFDVSAPWDNNFKLSKKLKKKELKNLTASFFSFDFNHGSHYSTNEQKIHKFNPIFNPLLLFYRKLEVKILKLLGRL